MLIFIVVLLLYVSLATWRVVATSQHLQSWERAAWVAAVIFIPIIGLLAYAVLRSSNQSGLTRA